MIKNTNAGKDIVLDEKALKIAKAVGKQSWIDNCATLTTPAYRDLCIEMAIQAYLKAGQKATVLDEKARKILEENAKGQMLILAAEQKAVPEKNDCPRCFGTKTDPINGRIGNPCRCNKCGGSGKIIEQKAVPGDEELVKIVTAAIKEATTKRWPGGESFEFSPAVCQKAAKAALSTIRQHKPQGSIER